MGKNFALSFPLGRGIDYLEPSFGTLRREPGAITHGTCLLLPLEDARKLDRQEGPYLVETHKAQIYAGDENVDGKAFIDAEVYAPARAEPEGHPQGPCSKRYRNILANAAKSMKLADDWINKLENLETYTPSDETLARRKQLPIFDLLPGLPSIYPRVIETQWRRWIR